MDPEPECDSATGFYIEVTCLGTCRSKAQVACDALDSQLQAQAMDLLAAHR